MTTFIKGIQEELMARVKNMLAINFVIAWLLVNYEVPLIMLFDERSISQKITFLDDFIFNLGTSVLIPLTIALLYIFIMPLLNLIITKIHDVLVHERVKKHENKKMTRYYLDKKEVEKAKLDSSVFLQRTMDVDLKKKENEVQYEAQSIKDKIDSFEQFNREIKEYKKEESIKEKIINDKSNLISEKDKIIENSTKTHDNLVQVKIDLESLLKKVEDEKKVAEDAVIDMGSTISAMQEELDKREKIMDEDMNKWKLEYQKAKELYHSSDKELNSLKTTIDKKEKEYSVKIMENERKIKNNGNYIKELKNEIENHIKNEKSNKLAFDALGVERYRAIDELEKVKTKISGYRSESLELKEIIIEKDKLISHLNNEIKVL